MAFLVETHMHTAQISPCGQVPAADAVAQYHGAGFDAVIITDHMRDDVLEAWSGDWDEKIDRWMQGYRLALETGRRLGIGVWPGVEITFPGSREDYLIYGMDEGFLYRHPGLITLGLAAVRDITLREDVLLVQAHPFRPYGGPADPRYLDGVEIANGNPRQDSHPELAEAFCTEHGLIATGGSDYHQPQDLSVGMAFERPLRDVADFARALRRGEGRIVDATRQDRADKAPAMT